MRNDSEENLWGMRIIAFVMALLLFTFVTYENSQSVQSNNPGDGASITGVEVLEDVPININVDRESYYVSGIPESAEVRLRGPQSLILQTLATQNVTVETPDLNELGLGMHEIELYVDNLSDQIEYRIDPMTVTVTIEERVAQPFNLSLSFREEDVAAGYEVGEPELSQSEVLVTGSATSIANIDTVQVVVPSGEEEYTDSINMSLPVVVTDREGELMDVSVEPSEVNVFIPIERPEKTVPLTIEEVGDTNENFNYDVSFAADQEDEITISGPSEQLAEIQEWPIEVDLSGIEEDTELNIPVGTYRGISETNMETVSVTVEVVEGASDEDDTAASDDSDPEDASEGDEAEAEADTEVQTDTDPETTTNARNSSSPPENDATNNNNNNNTNNNNNNNEGTSTATSEDEESRENAQTNDNSGEQDSGIEADTTDEIDESNAED